ncbi:MAG: hypothetical protein ACETWB_02415 [Anaerolineae bacterium]
MSWTGRLTKLARESINADLGGSGTQHKVAERLGLIGLTSAFAPYLSLQDSEQIKFGAGEDITLAWDNTNSVLEFLPATDDTGALNIGDGTTDMDLKIFMGSTTAYVNFDNSAARVYFEDTVLSLNSGGSTTGNGYPLSATQTGVLKVYGDDANAAIGSGSMIKPIEGRLLLTYTGGNREQEAVGILGKIVSVAGVNRHNMCGLMGSYEVGTSLTVDGQVYTIDPWIQAAVIGRVGAGSAITTINTYGILAAFAAMSNTTSFAANSGEYDGLYIGRWGSLAAFTYGIHMETGAVSNGILIGNSTTGVTLTSASNFALQVYTTCASVHASNSVQPIYMKSIMTGAGGVGGRACFHMYTTADLGGWANALKGYSEFGTSGRCAGLASAVVAEMKLPNENIVAEGGGYFPLEIEYVAAGDALVTAGGLTGNHVGFIWMQASGDTDGDFDDNGFIMHIRGLTAGAAHVFRTGLTAATVNAACTAALRIGVGDTTYYIPLATATA